MYCWHWIYHSGQNCPTSKWLGIKPSMGCTGRSACPQAIPERLMDPLGHPDALHASALSPIPQWVQAPFPRCTTCLCDTHLTLSSQHGIAMTHPLVGDKKWEVEKGGGVQRLQLLLLPPEEGGEEGDDNKPLLTGQPWLKWVEQLTLQSYYEGVKVTGLIRQHHISTAYSISITG